MQTYQSNSFWSVSFNVTTFGRRILIHLLTYHAKIQQKMWCFRATVSGTICHLCNLATVCNLEVSAISLLVETAERSEEIPKLFFTSYIPSAFKKNHQMRLHQKLTTKTNSKFKLSVQMTIYINCAVQLQCETMFFCYSFLFLLLLWRRPFTF